MFKRILIANRGEIALRVQRTCRELGIETVAVYSEPDRNLLHVRHADRAVHIGDGPAIESYLNIEKIINAAKDSGADAIHPGYGFLSENASFADACADANITFIGPSGDAMKNLGDKISARKIMEDANVPIVPGANDVDPANLTAAASEADRVGYPLLVKASAGGGGRGIRLVEKPEDLENAMRLASSEASSSFGNATIFFERFVSPARHIEVQIVADSHGNVSAFGERECSVQRRNQKVLEEAPSIAVNPAIREKLCAAAIAAAKGSGYENAGTVEFLMDNDGEFYFLEVNARLQVEHPVTELVYGGIDLVALQIAVADGGTVTDGLVDSGPIGWAIECRINGEDPYQNFRPSLGLIDYVEYPNGPGVRFDSMLFSGLDVPVFYDSLLGKLIVWAETRELAIQRMQRALQDLVISGPQTNIPFHRELMNNKDFQNGDIYTNWLENNFSMPEATKTEEEINLALTAAAIASLLKSQNTAGQAMPVNRVSKWTAAARKNSTQEITISSGEAGWRRGTR